MTWSIERMVKWFEADQRRMGAAVRTMERENTQVTHGALVSLGPAATTTIPLVIRFGPRGLALARKLFHYLLQYAQGLPPSAAALSTLLPEQRIALSFLVQNNLKKYVRKAYLLRQDLEERSAELIVAGERGEDIRKTQQELARLGAKAELIPGIGIPRNLLPPGYL